MSQTEDFPVAIIADIHGNVRALEAVLGDIERRGISRIINLGDSLLGPLEPAQTADLLIDRNIASISGNDDRVLLTVPVHPSLTWNYVQTQLTPAHRNWLHALPQTAIVSHALFACHGAPDSDDTYLLEDVQPGGVFLKTTSSIAPLVASVTQPVVLCAHSHVPRTVFLSPNTLIVNPGSVGLPAYTLDQPVPHRMEAGSPHARYAIISPKDSSWQVEHIQVPYDWEQAAQVARSHQREDWALWLSTGRAEK